MKILMLCPHVRISGGVKVIFRIAEGLMKNGIKVCVAINKAKHKNLLWYPFKPLPFKITEIKGLTAKDYNSYDCIVNYGDGPPLTHIATKKILFLQGLASTNKAAEVLNLQNNYNMIITTSKWLHDVAKQTGHSNVQIVPPGVDSIFKPVTREANRIPIIGGLFHSSPDKQFNLLPSTAHRLFVKDKLVTHSVVLAAQPIKGIKLLDTWILPYSLIINPPQTMISSMYSACDVWFSTSNNEGFGLPPLEAMACGVPVIWYPNAGLYGHINETNCMVIKDTASAANAIKTILENPDKRNSLINNGIKLAAKFTWEKSVKQFLECVRGL